MALRKTMPGEKRQMKSAHSEHWNKSEQGQRLNREWSSVSDSRALKRSSEILSHRVDRMYFMNGNNIRLQPKYQVDEEELIHLRDASKSRQYSNQPRGPSSRMSSHRALNSGKSKASTDHAAEKKDRAKSLENIMTTRKMDNSEIERGKSPLHGWDNDGDKEEDLSVKGEVIRKKSFHEDQIAEGINDSAPVTQRSDKTSNKNEDGKAAETVEDEFDKPERADGRQNPDDVTNTDNNVVAVDDNEEGKNEDEKEEEGEKENEDENWKTRKTEEEESKNKLDETKTEDNGVNIDEKVDDKDDEIVNENTNEDSDEKNVVQEDNVKDSAKEEADKQEEVTDEQAKDENVDEET